MFYTACEKFTFADADKYRFIGRTDESFEGGVPISWSNSGLTFGFYGDRAVLHFGEYLSDQPVYVKVFADNMTQRFCLDGKSPKILLDFDEETAHTVKLLRISEGNTPLVFYEACVYGKAPALLPPPVEKRFALSLWAIRLPPAMALPHRVRRMFIPPMSKTAHAPMRI